VLKLSAYPDFVSGVSMHPSHPTIVQLQINEDEKALLEGAKSAKHVFMPAGDDKDSVKPGGLSEKVSIWQCQIISALPKFLCRLIA
jgi:hypothetical protein